MIALISQFQWGFAAGLGSGLLGQVIAFAIVKREFKVTRKSGADDGQS